MGPRVATGTVTLPHGDGGGATGRGVAILREKQVGRRTEPSLPLPGMSFN